MSPRDSNRAVGRVPFIDGTDRDVYEDVDGRQSPCEIPRASSFTPPAPRLPGRAAPTSPPSWLLERPTT